MTISFTKEQLYLATIILLIALEVYQWIKIKGLELLLETKIQNLVVNFAAALTTLERKIDAKQDKEKV